MKKNNKILLINTLPRIDYWRDNKDAGIGIPYGLLCIGTLLSENKYDVIIVDPLVDPEYQSIIDKNISDCLFIGISAMTAGVASGLQISDHIKRINTEIPIVWGGIHPTLFPESTLSDSSVDIVVLGEGEMTCLDLADTIKAEKPLDLVKGIGYKDKNQKQYFTEQREFIDLDKSPLIKYDLLDMEKYIYRDLKSIGVGAGKARVAIIQSSRGCPYKCNFCINTHSSQKHRSKSAERLLLEVDCVVERYNPEVIYFQDDNFFTDPHRIFSFFKEYKIRDYHFRWFSLTRANYFHEKYLSDAFIQSIAPSCLWLGMGIESGSEQIRKMINKELNEDQIMKAVKSLGKVNIPTGYAFMVGLPTEKPEDIFLSISLMERIKKIHQSAEFTYQYYRPYPGSQLYNTAIAAGYLPPDTLRGWANNRDIDIGYNSLDSLPWIEKPDLVKYLLLVVPLIFLNTEFKTNKLIWKVAQKYGRFSFFSRKKIDFWLGLSIEIWIGTRIRKMIS
jgi:anaerobic magnesium-protoporphyrin IX monomethyl ester cyclase